MKNYKEIGLCRMCKKRFTIVPREPGKKYSSRNYCPECCKKYFKPEKK